VFYYKADGWLGRKIEWIVCKECQKKLVRGETLPCVISFDPEAQTREFERD